MVVGRGTGDEEELRGGSWKIGLGGGGGWVDVRVYILLSRGSFLVAHRFPRSFVDGNQAWPAWRMVYWILMVR